MLVPDEPGDWALYPFLPRQMEAVEQSLRELATRHGFSADEAVQQWRPQVLEAARQAQFDLQLQYARRVTRRKLRHMEELARLAKRPLPGDKVPEHMRDLILLGAFEAGFDSENVEELTQEQVALAASAARRSPAFAGNAGGRPKDEATLDYCKELGRIYREVTRQSHITWSRTPRLSERGRPCGPCVRFVRACFAPLRPELKDEGLVELLRKSL